VKAVESQKWKGSGHRVRTIKSISVTGYAGKPKAAAWDWACFFTRRNKGGRNEKFESSTRRKKRKVPERERTGLRGTTEPMKESQKAGNKRARKFVHGEAKKAGNPAV